METVEQPVSLADCPPGLFLFGDILGFKTEYNAMDTVGPVDVPGDQIRWTVGRWPEAYVVASGEVFWGGASTHEDRAALLVQPFEASLPPSAPDRDVVERDMSGETVCGFRVAAYRETHPEHGDQYGRRYSEHWSTPSTLDPRVKVERLFTEDQLRAALALPPSGIAEAVRERCAKVVEDEMEKRRAEQKRDLFDNHLRGQINAALRIVETIRALDLSAISGGER